MSTTTYVFMAKKEKYQYFFIEKSALTRAMSVGCFFAQIIQLSVNFG